MSHYLKVKECNGGSAARFGTKGPPLLKTL